MTVTLATFMEVLDTSIANVALPHIAGALSASVDESTWVLTSYLVSNAIVLPMSAWLSTRVGRKRFYMSCVALFTVSSFLCGIAPSLGMLIFFRVLQGAGGGGLQPSEQSILADTFSPAQRGMAFAIYGMAVVLAPAIGPTLGGWITDNYEWRWIFFINIPVGIISMILTHRMIQDPPHLVREQQRVRRQGMRIDFIGLALLALAFGPLQVVLDKGEEDNWFQSHFIVAFAAIAAIAFVVGIIWELYQEHPIVNLRLYKNRNFAIASLLMFAFGFMLYGTTVLLPEFVQLLMGYTAELAGTILSPGALLIIALMPLVGILIARVDARWVLAFGFLVLSAFALPHDRDRSPAQLVERDDASHLSINRHRVSVRAHQHRHLHGSKARAEQPGIGPYQPDAQYRREHRNLADRRNDNRAWTVPSGGTGAASHLLQSASSSGNSEPGGTARAGGVEHVRCYPSGVRSHLCRPRGTGADACFHRHVLGDGDRHLVPDSAGLLPGEARAGQGGERALAGG